MASQSKHIVMLPFMAQGHLIPFLALAKLISQRHPSHTVTIVNTPLNIERLRSLLPSDPNAANIHLKSIPFNASDHGLPPGSENTDALPDPLATMTLMLASESLAPHFDRLVSDMTDLDRGRPPLCIISDVFCSWSVDVAERRRVFHATFTTCGAYGTAAYMSMWLNLPHVRPPLSQEYCFSVPCFPESVRFRRSQMSTYLRSATGSDPGSVFFRGHVTRSLRSDAMLCNTVEEVESKGVESLRNFTGLKVWAIGPLLRSETDFRTRPGNRGCIEWLDSKPPCSVVYVSFGSQNTITGRQMVELATGLEGSGRPFVWVVRPPSGFGTLEEVGDEWLPDGFESRMERSKRGLLVREWAPQLEILRHGSTGAFLSHCGWNSMLESLSCGVPIIGWPLAAEQFYNSKMMVEELGVGLEIARGLESEIKSGDVVKAVGLVMGGERGEGREMKKKAVECSEVIRGAMREGDGGGSSMAAIDGFVESVMAGARRSRDAVINDEV